MAANANIEVTNMKEELKRIQEAGRNEMDKRSDGYGDGTLNTDMEMENGPGDKGTMDEDKDMEYRANLDETQGSVETDDNVLDDTLVEQDEEEEEGEIKEKAKSTSTQIMEVMRLLLQSVKQGNQLAEQRESKIKKELKQMNQKVDQLETMREAKEMKRICRRGVKGGSPIPLNVKK